MNYFVKEKCLRGIYHQINVSSIFSQRSSRIYFTRPWNEKNFESAKETNKTNACNYLVDWILYHLKFANITSGIQGRETKNHKIPAISWAVADKNAMNVKHASSSQRAWMSGTRGRWPSRQEENFINFLDTYRGKQSNLREKSCHWIEDCPLYKISCSEHSDLKLLYLKAQRFFEEESSWESKCASPFARKRNIE